MGLFGNLFDFDGDGSTDALETALGLSIVFSIGADEKENTTAEDDDFNELGEDLFESGVEKLESSREELSELEEQLMDMECREPDDMMISYRLGMNGGNREKSSLKNKSLTSMTRFQILSWSMRCNHVR